MDILQETDTFHPLLLNIGYAIHHSDWNWTEVNSPFFRIYNVTKGMSEVTLPDRTITLSPHHLYIIPAFTCHNCHCEGDFEHYYLHIYEDHSSATSILEDLDFPTEVPAGPLDLELIKLLHEMNPAIQLPRAEPATGDGAPARIQNIIKNKQKAFHNKVASKGIIYMLISRFLKDAQPKRSSSDSRIINVVNLIRKNIDKNIDIDTLAGLSCLSKDHFIRLFKSEMKTTPLQYIVKKKIEKAQLLLITKDLAIKEIAYTLGYDNYSYFIKIFKKQTGLTPQTYKESNRKH